MIALVLLRARWGFQAQAVLVIHCWKQAEEQRPVPLTWNPWRWISWLNPLNTSPPPPPAFVLHECIRFNLCVCNIHVWECVYVSGSTMQRWTFLNIKYQCVGAFWASRRKCLRWRCPMWKPSRRSSEHGRCSQLVVVSPWLLLETWPAGEDPSASWGPAATCVAWEWVESIPKSASWLPAGCSIDFLWLLILLVLERKQQTGNWIRQERFTSRNVAPYWYSFAE